MTPEEELRRREREALERVQSSGGGQRIADYRKRYIAAQRTPNASLPLAAESQPTVVAQSSGKVGETDPNKAGVRADLERIRAGQTPTGEWADKLRENQDQLDRTLQIIANSDLSEDEKNRLIALGTKRQDKFWLWGALEWVDRWSGDAAVRALFSQGEKLLDPDEDPSWDSFYNEWQNNVSWTEILDEYEVPDWLTIGAFNPALAFADHVSGKLGVDLPIPTEKGSGPGGMGNTQTAFPLLLDILTSPTTYATGGSKAVAQFAGQGANQLRRGLVQAARVANEAGDYAKTARAAQLATRASEVGFGGLSQAERRLATDLLRESGELTAKQTLQGGIYLRLPGREGLYVPGTRALAGATYRPAAMAINSLRTSRAGRTASKPFATVQRQILAAIKSGDQGKIGQSIEALAARSLAEAESAHWFVEGDQILNSLIRRAKKQKVNPEEISYFLEDANSANAMNLAARYQADPKVRELLDDIVDFQRRHWLERFNRMAGYEAIPELENYVPTIMASEFMEKIFGKTRGMGSEFSRAGFQQRTQFRVGEKYLGIDIVPANMHPRGLSPKQQGQEILRQYWGDDFVGPLYDRNWFKAAKSRQFVARYRLRGELTARYLKERGVAWTPQQAERIFGAPLTNMKSAMARYGLRKMTEPAMAARAQAVRAGAMTETAGTRIVQDMRALEEIVSNGGSVKNLQPRVVETGQRIAVRDQSIRKLIGRRRQIAQRVERMERKLSTQVFRMTERMRKGGAATEAEQQAAATLSAWHMGFEPDDVAKLYDEWAEVDAEVGRYLAEVDLDADDLEKMQKPLTSLLTLQSDRLDVVNEALAMPRVDFSNENLMRLQALEAEKIQLEESLEVLLQIQRNTTDLNGSSRQLTRLRDGLDEEQAFNQARNKILEDPKLSAAQKRSRVRDLHKNAPITARHGLFSRAIDRLIEMAPDGVAKAPNNEPAMFVRRPMGMEAARARAGQVDLPRGALHGAPGRETSVDRLGLQFDFAIDVPAGSVDDAVDAARVNIKFKNPRMFIGVENPERVLDAEMFLNAVEAKLIDLSKLPKLRVAEKQFVEEVNAVIARHAGALDEGPDGVMRFVDDLDETLGRLADGDKPNPVAKLFVDRASERMEQSGGVAMDTTKMRRDLDALEGEVANKLDDLEGRYTQGSKSIAEAVNATDAVEAGTKVRAITQKMLDALEQGAPDARKALRKASKRAQKQKRPIYVSEYGEKDTVSALGYRIGVTDPKYGNYFRLNPDGTGDFIVVTPGRAPRKPVEAAPELPLATKIDNLEKLIRKQQQSARKAEREFAKFNAAIDEWDAFLATNPTPDAQVAKALEQRAALSPKSKRYTPEEAKALPRDYVETFDKWLRSMRKEHELRIGQNQSSIASNSGKLEELNVALRQESPLPAGALDPESPEAQTRFVRVTVGKKFYRDHLARKFENGWSVDEGSIPSPRVVKGAGANAYVVEGEYRTVRGMLDDLRAQADSADLSASERTRLTKARKRLEEQLKGIDESTDYELRPRSEFDWPPLEYKVNELEDLAQRAAQDEGLFNDLVDDYSQALQLEPDLRAIENPSGYELEQLNLRLIAAKKEELQTLEDYMVSVLGGYTDNNGMVRFSMVPQRNKSGVAEGKYTGEWDWFSHYTGREKRRMVLRWFRSPEPKGPFGGAFKLRSTQTGIDQVVMQAESILGRDISIDEFAEMVMEAIFRHEAISEDLKFYRNMKSQELVDEFWKENWEYVEHYGPKYLSTEYERLFDRVEEIQQGIPFERSVAFEQGEVAAKATDEVVPTAPAAQAAEAPSAAAEQPKPTIRISNQIWSDYESRLGDELADRGGATVVKVNKNNTVVVEADRAVLDDFVEDLKYQIENIADHGYDAGKNLTQAYKRALGSIRKQLAKIDESAPPATAAPSPAAATADAPASVLNTPPPPISATPTPPRDPNALDAIQRFRSTGLIDTPDPELAAALQAIKQRIALADELRGGLNSVAAPRRSAAFGLIDELVNPAVRSMARADGEEYLARLGRDGAWLKKLKHKPEDVAESYKGFLKRKGYDGVLSDDASFRRVIVLDQSQVRPVDRASRLMLQLDELQAGIRTSIRNDQEKLVNLADKAFGFRIERQTMSKADAQATAADNLARLRELEPSDLNRGEATLRTRAKRAFEQADEAELEGDNNLAMALRLEGQANAAEADQLAAGIGDDAGVLLSGKMAEVPGLAERIARFNGMSLKNLDANTVAEDWVVEMLTVGERLTIPGEVKGFLRVWDYLTNTLFKSYAIMTFGFHVRNLFGGVMNNWLGGVNVDSYRVFLQAEKSYFNTLRKTGNVDQALRAVDESLGKEAGEAYRLWHQMEASSGMGIVGSFSEDVGRGVGVLSDEVNKGGVGRFGAFRASIQNDRLARERALNPLVGLQDNALVRSNAYLGQRVERFLRGSMAFDTFYKKGGDFTDAMLRVRKYHFDYQDLSNFERGFLRRVIPFYVWVSRNIPLQVEGLVTRPKVALTYWRVKQWLEQQSEEEEITPYFYGREGAIRLPFTDANGNHMYWFPDMPLNDLSFFSSPVETLTSALNPLIKMPLEIGPMQRKFFTGAPFTEELQEMPKHYGWLGITQALEAMGQVTKDKDGRPMADQRLIYALEQGWPMFARLQRWFPTDEAGKARAANTYLSNFLGVSVRTNDERSKANQIRRVISQLDEELTKQRGLGSDVRIAGYREISDTTRTVELNMDRLRYETDYLLTAINTFDADQLEEIPGVGETVARWIVLSRQQNGEYTSLEDLMGLEQLSENKVNEILLSLADKPESMGLPAAKAIDINSGTADELEKIDGIGPTTAAKIIDFRTRFGPITSVWQLAEIDGVTRRQVEQIRAYYLDDEARRASEEYQRYLRMGGGRPIEEVVTP